MLLLNDNFKTKKLITGSFQLTDYREPTKPYTSAWTTGVRQGNC
jgi:hypothetical protein